ncbi:Hypothetical predicted protein, partial [Olea europaea subsp. europaea]
MEQGISEEVKVKFVGGEISIIVCSDKRLIVSNKTAFLACGKGEPFREDPPHNSLRL